MLEYSYSKTTHTHVYVANKMNQDNNVCSTATLSDWMYYECLFTCKVIVLIDEIWWLGLKA